MSIVEVITVTRAKTVQFKSAPSESGYPRRKWGGGAIPNAAGHAITRLGLWKKPFLKALARTGNISESCWEARINYVVYVRAKKQDPKFARRCRIALIKANDVLHKEAWRRAVHGVPKAVYHNGKKCGKIREFSDTLLIFLMKGENPKKYRENYSITHKGKIKGKVQHNHGLDLSQFSSEELVKLETAARGGASGTVLQIGN